VIACIGIDVDGRLLNVNADTFAGHLAARLGAGRLVIAGTTPGVLNERGETTTVLELGAIDRLIHAGTATAGMVAKLNACAHALSRGVGDVVIVDGRDRAALEAAAIGSPPATATRVVQTPVGRTRQA
jgi:acetylglutamate kinase